MFDKIKSMMSKPKESPVPQTIKEAIGNRKLPQQSLVKPISSSSHKSIPPASSENKINNQDLETLQDFLIENNLDISCERCEAWLENQLLEIIIKNVLWSIENNETSIADLEHAILTNSAEEFEPKTHNEIDCHFNQPEELSTLDFLNSIENTPDINLNEQESSSDIVTKIDFLLSELDLSLDDIIQFYAEHTEAYIVAQLEYMINRKQTQPISSPAQWLQGCIQGNYAKFTEMDSLVHEQHLSDMTILENVEDIQTSPQKTTEYVPEAPTIAPVTNPIIEQLERSDYLQPVSKTLSHVSLQASVVKTKWQAISALSAQDFTDLLIKSNCYCSSEFCIHYAICYYRRDGSVEECDACKSGISDMLNKPIEFIKNIEV